MKAPSLAYLNEIYRDAEAADKEIFAEYRQNILLVAGEHYTRKSYQFLGQQRTGQDVSEKTKLRITKNHAHKIQRYYVDTTLDYSPDVAVLPVNELDLQDQKSAELNQAVWGYIKPQIRFREKRRKWCKSFVGVGEVAVKIFFDPFKGKLQGFEPVLNDDGSEKYLEDSEGNYVATDEGDPQPIPDKTKPVFKGQLCCEEIPAYNLLRTTESKDMRECDCWIVRKLLPTKRLQRMYADDEEKLAFIGNSSEEEFIVFDAQHGGYMKAKNQCLVREFYWPQSQEFPEGWFTIATMAGVLEEGPLPGGVFPIVWQAFDTFEGSPRGRGIMRVARSYIHEINRASSSQALHQITIGDDKVLYQAGTKLAQGGLLPGVRGITFQGQPPTILPGRDGAQYSAYIKDTIYEMYDNLMIGLTNKDKAQQLDPISLMFATAMQRKDFAEYAEKFEIFLCDVAFTFLELAKFYMPDDELVYAAGKREYVNIEEFRSTDPLRSQIKVDPSTETLEMRMGKYLTGMNILQYVGGQLKPQDIGRLATKLPFANFKDTFDDLTMDSRNAENEMLSIERGQPPFVSEFENTDYIAQRLVTRMKAPDFNYLPQQVQQLYHARYQQCLQTQAEQQQKIIQAKNEYIPVDGGLVRCDMYVPMKTDPTRTERAAVPQRALEWLVKQLETQGMSLDKMQEMNQGQLSQLAGLLAQGGQGQAQGQQQPPQPGPAQQGFLS